ncbi:MAG: cytidylate kinase-like family protein [Thermodesulfobacteriota bacterium]
MAIVCISRQFGAGGRTLAGRIAERLDYEFADTELTNRVAQEAGVSDEWVKVTEREGGGPGKNFISSLFSSGFMERILGDKEMRAHEKKLVPLFQKFMLEMAARGNMVFLGRGCQFILPDRPDVVKVLLVAPHEFRVNFLIEHHNLSKGEALETIREWDRNRSAFLKKLTDKDPDDTKLYDLTLNTGLIRLDWAEHLVCHLVEQRSGAGSGR